MEMRKPNLEFHVSQLNPEEVLESETYTDTEYIPPRLLDFDDDVVLPSGSQGFQCTVCDKVYKLRTSYKQHLFSHRPDIIELTNPTSPTDKNIFRASTGWLQRYCRRTGNSSRIMYGEKGSSDEKAATDYVQVLHNMLVNDFKHLTFKEVMKIVMNFDEFGWVTKSLPRRSYVTLNTPVKAKKTIN